MDNYFEQSVVGERGTREQFLYMLCWAGIVVLGLIALSSVVNVIGISEESIAINWGSLILLLVSAGLVFLLYRQKDKVYCEYDYILWNSELEICAVYNRKRRKKVATIPLNKLKAWGPAGALANRMHNVKPANWCVHRDAAWCLLYPAEDGDRAALLELSEEMCAQLRASDSHVRLAEVKA